MRHTDQRWLLPLVAAALMLGVYLKDARAEVVKGTTKNGSAFICEMKPKWPLLQFCVYLTVERR